MKKDYPDCVIRNRGFFVMSVDVSVMSFLKSAAILQSKKAVLKNGQKKGHFLSVYGVVFLTFWGYPRNCQIWSKKSLFGKSLEFDDFGQFRGIRVFWVFWHPGGVPNFKVLDPTRFVNVTGDPDEWHHPSWQPTVNRHTRHRLNQSDLNPKGRHYPMSYIVFKTLQFRVNADPNEFWNCNSLDTGLFVVTRPKIWDIRLLRELSAVSLRYQAKK